MRERRGGNASTLPVIQIPAGGLKSFQAIWKAMECLSGAGGQRQEHAVPICLVMVSVL